MEISKLAAVLTAGITAVALASAKAWTAFNVKAEDKSSVHELGDVDRNGSVTSADASLILKAYADISTGNASTLDDEQLFLANVNSDGAISSTDASLVLKYYSALSGSYKGSVEEFLQEEAKTTVPAQTTTTTAVTAPPVTTTTAAAVPLNIGEWTLNDINTSAEAFEAYSDQLRVDLFGPEYTIYRYNGRNGELRTTSTSGKVLLALLNIDSISPEVLKEVFDYYTEDDIYYESTFLCEILELEHRFETSVDLRQYILDKDLAYCISEFMRMGRDKIYNGSTEITDVASDYFYDIDTKYGIYSSSKAIKNILFEGIDANAYKITGIEGIVDRFTPVDELIDAYKTEGTEPYKLMDILFGKVYTF